MQEEIWKPVVGYEGLYEVSNLGRVKSLYDGGHKMFREKILKPSPDKDGYQRVTLSKSGKSKTKKIHRLVANAFIYNDFPLFNAYINHKDEDKANNQVDNLEWCDYGYNNNFGTRNDKVAKTLSKPIIQFSIDGKFIAEYPSAMEAQRQLGFLSSNICTCCQGKHKQAYGYVWKYK